MLFVAIMSLRDLNEERFGIAYIRDAPTDYHHGLRAQVATPVREHGVEVGQRRVEPDSHVLGVHRAGTPWPGQRLDLGLAPVGGPPSVVLPAGDALRLRLHTLLVVTRPPVEQRL